RGGTGDVQHVRVAAGGRGCVSVRGGVATATVAPRRVWDATRLRVLGRVPVRRAPDGGVVAR
ncbi:hypothetical protein ACWC4J_40990, partial [Streptomyces sp. NPDC001356]